MARIVAWVQSVALAIGGPGLFFIAFLDSSFLSLPEINDLLVVLLVIQHKERMLYYALMATLGSLAGCLVLYYVGRKGGAALARRRFGGRSMERALALYQRYGALAIAIPAVLPPPSPFKVFVLLAGIAGVPVLHFATVIALARGFRYTAEAWLAVRYGDQAIALIEENGRAMSIALAVVVIGSVLAWLIWRSRRREPVEGE
ncbi:MAG: VTT domain-containing protein [Acidobacteria bacterium]|nr:VTT domain-containing protein [Acidobacteriota bacterium]